MDSPAPSKRNRALRRAVGFLGLAGLLLLALYFVNESRIARLQAGVRSSDPRDRAKAHVYIGDERERRVLDAVLHQLERETDREILEKAGYATMRLGDPRGLELLRRRAAEGPDDWTRGKLIIYTARLSKAASDPPVSRLQSEDGRSPRVGQGSSRPVEAAQNPTAGSGTEQALDLIPWLENGLRSPHVWERVASAVALLELGRPEAGQALLEWLPGLDAEVRKFALAEFRKRIGEPMTQAAGQPMDWDGLPDAPPTDARWAQLRDFWRAHATPRLLHDVLVRQDRHDPDWSLMKRLLHGREKVERLLF